MTPPLVVVRPEPGLGRTLAEARELGLSAVGAPLFTIAPRAWSPPDPGDVDALLIGSANAVLHAGAGLRALAEKPVHAVGEATADAARAAGLAVATVGEGGLQRVLDGLAGERLRLLRLAGEEHVSLAPPAGIELATRIVYASGAQAIPAGIARALTRGAVVALHSAAAARHFAAECDRLRISRKGIGVVALAPRVAEAAGAGWRAVETAPRPSDTALLALARDMCHGPPSEGAA